MAHQAFEEYLFVPSLNHHYIVSHYMFCPPQ